MSLMKRGLVAFAGLAILSAPAIAKESTNVAIDNWLGPKSHEAYQILFRRLQAAVVNHDEKEVANLVQYPLNVTVDDHILILKNRGDFVAHYEKVISPKIVAAVKTQRYGALAVSHQGVFFDHHEIGIGPVCEEHGCRFSVPRVIDINP